MRLDTKAARLRARHIYPHTFAVRRHNLDAVVYIDLPRLTAQAFIGTAAKHCVYQRFRNVAAMERRVKELFDNLQAHNENKAAHTARRNAPHTLQLGDILRTCWGYDQTNVEFFQVVKLIGASMVEVRELCQERVTTEFMQGRCTPIKDKFTERGEPLRRRATSDNRVKIHSSATASPWDGTPASYSSYA